MVPFKIMVYVGNKAEYVPADEKDPTDKVLNLSGTEFRRRLCIGLDIPAWFLYPSVVSEPRKAHPPKYKQGFTVFNCRAIGFRQVDRRRCTDGEITRARLPASDPTLVRKHLSCELSFSREQRDLNIQRIGVVASEITEKRRHCHLRAHRPLCANT